MQEDAESSAHSTWKPEVRLTPAIKFREDPSMEFQPLSDGEKDVKNHIIQNVCSTFWKDTNKLDNFPMHDAIWSNCLWAVLCLSEEDEKFKRIPVNHQIHKTKTIIETVQARLQDLTNVAAEFHGISLWQNSLNILSLLEPPVGVY